VLPKYRTIINCCRTRVSTLKMMSSFYAVFISYILYVYICISGAGGSIVVKALHCYSEGLGINPQWCRWGFFLKLPMEPCALGSRQPVHKGDNLTTFIVQKVEKIWSLKLTNPQGPVVGKLYLYLIYVSRHQ
jgi:hypothetical protein